MGRDRSTSGILMVLALLFGTIAPPVLAISETPGPSSISVLRTPPAANESQPALEAINQTAPPTATIRFVERSSRSPLGGRYARSTSSYELIRLPPIREPQKPTEIRILSSRSRVATMRPTTAPLPPVVEAHAARISPKATLTVVVPAEPLGDPKPSVRPPVLPVPAVQLPPARQFVNEQFPELMPTWRSDDYAAEGSPMTFPPPPIPPPPIPPTTVEREPPLSPPVLLVEVEPHQPPTPSGQANYFVAAAAPPSPKKPFAPPKKLIALPKKPITPPKKPIAPPKKPAALPKKVPTKPLAEKVDPPKKEESPKKPLFDSPIRKKESTQADDLFALPSPTTERPRQRLTVAEAVRLGIENNKDIVVLSHIPSINATEVETQKAPFDPVTGANAYGGQSDLQVRSLIDTFGDPADFLETDFLRPFQPPNDLYVRRRLYTGGEMELGFSTDYQNFSPEGIQLLVNPGWDSAFNFRFDQPLFRGRGPDATTAPIRIAQARRNQSRFVFMSEMREIARDIELAYWELAGADRTLQAIEDFVDRAKELLKQEVERKNLGKSALPNVLLVRNLMEEFEVLAGDQQQVRDIAESRLRQVMGLQSDGDPCWTPHGIGAGFMTHRLAAAEESTAFNTDMPWESYVQMALKRPEMLAQNASVRAAEIDVRRAKNGMQPDISARVDYSVNGLERTLGESLGTIGRHEFNTWGVGLIYERPLGLRAQKADLRRTRLTVAQETTRLDQIRHNILHALRRAEEIARSTEALLEMRLRREVTAKAQMDAFDTLYHEGRVNLFLRLESERMLATARSESAQAWTRYQLAVASRNYEANLVSPAYRIEP